MNAIRSLGPLLCTSIAAALLGASPAQALIPSIQCDTPAAQSALALGGSQQNVEVTGSCTTSALALASTNGRVLGLYTYDSSGGANTYTRGSDTFVRYYSTGLMESGAHGTGQSVFARPESGSLGAGLNTVNASGVFTNYTNNLYSPSGLVRSFDPSLVAVAVNNNVAVAGTSFSGGVAEPVYLAPGAVTGTNLDPLGLGGFATSINNLGQVAGVVTASDGSTHAFYTGAIGAGTHVLGIGPGVSSFANVIADDGQVGGYIALASGQTQAFLTTAHGGTLVGIGAGSPTDSTQTVYANSLGQAIVDDLSTQSYYLYSSGSVVPVGSLFAGGLPSGYTVVGLDNAGEILIQDPDLIALNLQALVPTNLVGLSGSVDLLSTQTYSDFVSAQGGAGADAAFLAPPAAVSGSVPEPGSWALAGVGVALLALSRRRRPTA